MIVETTISQLRAREALYQKRGASRLNYWMKPYEQATRDLWCSSRMSLKISLWRLSGAAGITNRCSYQRLCKESLHLICRLSPLA
jgi:hypothetical protein